MHWPSQVLVARVSGFVRTGCLAHTRKHADITQCLVCEMYLCHVLEFLVIVQAVPAFGHDGDPVAPVTHGAVFSKAFGMCVMRMCCTQCSGSSCSSRSIRQGPYSRSDAAGLETPLKRLYRCVWNTFADVCNVTELQHVDAHAA